LMWLILDVASSEADTALAQHVLHVHREGKPPVGRICLSHTRDACIIFFSPFDFNQWNCHFLRFHLATYVHT
jgi:DNA replicative helicase MCM subunit Mcm2 (Cdc46/Mcm family)